MMRTFLALPLPEAFKEALAEELVDLRDNHPELRWTADENLHITLLFLGELERADVALLVDAAGRAAASSCAARVSAGSLLTLPKRRPARILALGLQSGEEDIRMLLSTVRRRLWETSRAAGRAFALPAAGRFTAHITLARSPREPLKLFDREWNAPVAASAVLDTLTVFKSDLRPSGPRYTPLAEFPLGGRGGAPW